MKNLNDLELVTHLRGLVLRERELVAEVLRYLREVEVRQLYLSRGHTSLFAFCREELGYSEPEAQLRIQSMRLVRQVPEVAAKIERGELSMSVAAQIQTAARREKLARPEVKALVNTLTGSSKREAERKIATLFPDTPRPERARAVSEELVEIRFTITREQAAQLEALLDRRAHTNFDRRYDKLFSALVAEDLARKCKAGPKAKAGPEAKAEPEAKAPVEIPQESPAQDAPPQRPEEVITRYIPTGLRRAIYLRDQNSCQYRDRNTGRRCGSRHGLQIDHIKPFAEGGAHTAENLRLLCGAHNRWRHN